MAAEHADQVPPPLETTRCRPGWHGAISLSVRWASLERITLPYAEYDAVGCVCANKPTSACMRRVWALLIHESLQQAPVEGQTAILQLDRTQQQDLRDLQGEEHEENRDIYAEAPEHHIGVEDREGE